MDDTIKNNPATEKSAEEKLAESTAEAQKEKEQQEAALNKQLEALWSTGAHQLLGDHVPEQKTFTPEQKNKEKEIKIDYTNNKDHLLSVSENHAIATINNKDTNDIKE